MTNQNGWHRIVYSAYRTKQRPLKPHCGARRRSDLSGIDPETSHGCGSSLHCRECLDRSCLCTQVKIASGAGTVLLPRSYSQAAALNLHAVFCSDDELRNVLLRCSDCCDDTPTTGRRNNETRCSLSACRGHCNPPPPKLKL